MQSKSFVSLLLGVVLSLGGLQAQAKSLAYPGPDNASFLIDHPADWTVEPGEEVGDYVTLTGPTGVVLQLRTIPGDESAIEEALEDNRKFISETFSNVKIGDAEELKQGKLSGFYASGAGLDEDKAAIGFSMAFFALDDGNIAEIWFSVHADDQAGADAAGKVLNSLRTP
jgi:hypothetical protein